MTKSIYRKIVYLIMILWLISTIGIIFRGNFLDDFTEATLLNSQIRQFETVNMTKTYSGDYEQKIELNFKSKEDKAKYEELKARQNVIYQRHNSTFDKACSFGFVICSWLTLFFLIAGLPYYDRFPEQ